MLSPFTASQCLLLQCDLTFLTWPLGNEVAISKWHLADDLLRLRNHSVNRSSLQGLLVLHKTLAVCSKQWTFIIEGRLKIWGSSSRWQWDYVSRIGRKVCASPFEEFWTSFVFIMAFIQIITGFQDSSMVQRESLSKSRMGEISFIAVIEIVILDWDIFILCYM